MQAQSNVARQMAPIRHGACHQPRLPRPIGTLRPDNLREAAWLIVHAIQANTGSRKNKTNSALWGEKQLKGTFVFIDRDFLMYAIPESSPFAHQRVKSNFASFMGCYVPPSIQRRNCLPADVDGLTEDLAKHIEELTGRKL